MTGNEVGVRYLECVCAAGTPSQLRWGLQLCMKAGTVTFPTVWENAELQKKLVADLQSGNSRATGFRGEFGEGDAERTEIWQRFVDIML